MRNILLVLCFAFLMPIAMHAQKSVNHFFNKYYGEEDVISVELNGLMLKLVANIADDETEGAKEILSSINHLKVLVLEDNHPVSNKEVRTLMTNVQDDGFEELMTVKDGDTRINFLIKEKNDIVTGLLILVKDGDSFVLLNLKGKIKFSDLQKLDFEVEGGNHFKKIPKNKMDVPRA